MNVSSRTPEGFPTRCPHCQAEAAIEYSPETGDASCPVCGSLLWKNDPLAYNPILEPKFEIQKFVDWVAVDAVHLDHDEAFYETLLHRLVISLAAHAGQIWITDSANRPQKICETGIEKLGQDMADTTENIAETWYAMAHQTGAFLVEPGAIHCVSSLEFENTSDFLLLFGSMWRKEEYNGFVVIWQRTTDLARTKRGYLRFVEQICELLNNP